MTSLLFQPESIAAPSPSSGNYGYQGMKLRPYQAEDMDAVEAVWANGYRAVLVRNATGLGKSVQIAERVRRARNNPGRTLVVVNIGNLAEDLRDTILFHTGREPAILTGWKKGDWFRNQIVVATVQSLYAGKQGEERFRKLKPMDFSKVLVDECEGGCADRYGETLLWFKDGNPDLKIAGFTATPFRTDKRGMSTIFDHVVEERGPLNRDLQWGVMEGWLTTPRQAYLHCDLDFSSLRLRKGKDGDKDYSDKAVAKKMLEMDGKEWMALAHGIIKTATVDGRIRHSLVVCPNITIANAVADYLNGATGDGGSAEPIHGKLGREEAYRRLNRFSKGEFEFGVVCDMGGVGFDKDDLECVFILRRTKSRRKYEQWCLDEKTKILTQRGWMGPDDIKDEDMVAAFSTDDGSVRWSTILNRVDRPLRHNECMYGIKSPCLDIRVTNNHRMVLRRKIGRKQVRTPWVKERAEDAAAISSFELPIAGYQHTAGLCLTDDELRFIGWFLSDGHVNKVNRAITIAQADHSPYRNDLEACLRGCGMKYGVSVQTRKTEFSPKSTIYRYIISRGMPKGTKKHLRGWAHLEPYIDKDVPAALEGISRHQLWVLLESMNLGDGHKFQPDDWTQRSLHITSGNPIAVSRIQSLCVRRGIKCNVAESTAPNGNPYFCMHIKDKSFAHVMSRSSDTRPVFTKLESRANERVWCVTVDTGAIVTMRNGKVAVVGNCGRATRPLRAIRKTLDAAPDADARRQVIAESNKPNSVIVDCVGINEKAKNLLSVLDVIGDNVSEKIRERAKQRWLDESQKDKKNGKEHDVGKDARQARDEIKAEREEERKARAIRQKMQADIKVQYGETDMFTGRDGARLDVTRLTDGGATHGEIRTLRDIAHVPDKDLLKMSPQEVKDLHKVTMARKSAKLVYSHKMEKLLHRFGYDTSDMPNSTAKKLIGELQANNWKRP